MERAAEMLETTKAKQPANNAAVLVAKAFPIKR
jgi:hypothetical protein